MRDDSKCKLCGIPCKTEYTDRTLVDLYSCKACGQYESAVEDGKVAQFPLPDDSKHLLSALVRSHCDRTGRPYLFSDRPPGGAFPLDLPETPVTERITLALLLISDRATFLGDTVQVDTTLDWPLIRSRGPAEFKAILKHLLATKLLSTETSIDTQPAFATLSALGWKDAERHRTGKIRARQAFVAMAFSPEFTAAYETGIEPALIECGYAPWRSDREHFVDRIDDRIILEIRRSGLLVADVTMHRQGVYFEAGFAMGLGIPVLWTCREDDIKNAHFDTRQYPHVTWRDNADLRRRLTDRVQALFPRAEA